MQYESLIFDIDGTLWDSRALVAEGYNRQLRDEGLEEYAVDVPTLTRLFGKTMEEIGDSLFPRLPRPQRLALMERCMAREDAVLLDDPCQIGYPGVCPVLEQLAKTHRLFIVSNSQSGYPQICMDKLGIGHLISAALCFGDTGTQKGETIRTLMAQHGITSACYIGDTQGDLDAARFAGLDFLWAAYGFGSPENWVLRLNAPEDLLSAPL